MVRLGRPSIRRRTTSRRTLRVRPLSERLEERVVLSAVLPDGFTHALYVDGIDRPTDMVFTPDGRILVAEQGGTLRVVKDGQLLDEPFVAVDVMTDGERGLIGVTVDPHFEHNGYVYVHYTTTQEPVRNIISRFTADGDVARPGSEHVILELDPVGNANQHNGGAMHFGLDGKLYIAVGENAFAPNAATLDNPFGKMLRINPDGSIPTDNPFYNVAEGINRAIWALGLRNPFTFAIQPGTGLMYINDVGASAWEEINQGIAGADYGWPETEGPTDIARYRSPIYAYPHGTDDQTGCAITGGVFYNPETLQFPSVYEGQYFFADYCNQWIRQLNPRTHEVSGFATGLAEFIVDLAVSPDGTLCYLARNRGLNAGTIHQIRYTADLPAEILRDPQNMLVSVGFPATFEVHAVGRQPLHYQWQRDGEDIDGANEPTFTIDTTTLDDHGARFRVVVTNELGVATSQEATLSVTIKQPPQAIITAPAEGTRYNAGDEFLFTGVGIDSEIGELPPEHLTWWIDFHHDEHTHPYLPPLTNRNEVSLSVRTSGEKDANVWFRVYLQVTDTIGLTATTYREIYPNTSFVTLASSPSGAPIRLEGQPFTTPHRVESVVHMPLFLQAVSPVILNGEEYVFDAWLDGEPLTRTITTAAENETFRAYYRPRDGRTDLAVFRPTDGHWFLIQEATPDRPFEIGRDVRRGPLDAVPVPGDYDGDGVPDLAVFRPETAIWYIDRTTDRHWHRQFGAPNLDIPVPGDYDGDGRTDLAVFRPTTAEWFILNSGSPAQVIQFGAPDLDIPVPADYNGDGRIDLAVFRPTTAEWFIRYHDGRAGSFQLGAPGRDLPVPADYDGDRKADLAVFRPDTAEWFIVGSTAGAFTMQFGAPDRDIPVPADYDGDGRADLAVYRPDTAEWFQWRSTSGPRERQFGWGGVDVPAQVPIAFRHVGGLDLATAALATRTTATPPGDPEPAQSAFFRPQSIDEALTELAPVVPIAAPAPAPEPSGPDLQLRPRDRLQKHREQQIAQRRARLVALRLARAPLPQPPRLGPRA